MAMMRISASFLHGIMGWNRVVELDVTSS